MAHFAELKADNVVLRVIVVNNEVITENGEEKEQIGIDFLTNLYGGGIWKQTSYNNNFRKNYAGIGYKYDQTRDAFIPPKPFPSWVLDEDICNWDAPVPYPDDGKMYDWDELTMSWIEMD
tara:strand:- start:1216 stop:1575 length:360 start_codon:yes stop_codon:yes gene_type:complete